MLTSYLKTALWSSTGDDDEPLDEKYDVRHFPHESVTQAQNDLDLFVTRCAEHGIDLGQFDSSKVGHHFWLTRNGHGSSFLDTPKDWGGEETADKLTGIANSFGEIDLYVGVDGHLYFA